MNPLLFSLLRLPLFAPDEPAAAPPAPADGGPTDGGEPPPAGAETDPTPAGGDEGKPTLIEGDAKPPAAPEWADWTGDSFREVLPEGLQATDEERDALVGIVNTSKGDTKALMQGLLKYYADTTKALEASMVKEAETLQTKMQEEVKNDPTYGKDNFDASMRTAKETAQRYGGEPFMQMLRATGAGNSLAMVRFLNEVAKVLPKEGEPAPAGAPTATPKTLAQRLNLGA